MSVPSSEAGRSSGTGARPGRGGGSGEAERDGFRPDLEGLRAVAVGLVLLFHAGIPHATGGYVGVDVFFVLSGFLITGLIVREMERTGTVSLVAFYARRVRRLLPAAAVALVATIIASALFLPPLRVADVAGDGAAAALYASNMRFAFQATDYLQAELDPSPLLHYWSLGVEEQFYLFWPALLLLVTRGGRGTIGRLAAVVTIVFGTSVVLSIVLTQVAQPWAFFTLPARAWELAMGAALALAATRRLALPRSWSMPVGFLGLACIVAAGVVFDTATPFPGVAALLPTFGAALVIAAGLRGPTDTAASVPLHIRLLSLPPMRWLGRISYSLYLWHWPILVIPAAALEAPLSLRERVALALVAVVVAAISQRWVEEPIRHGRFVGFRPRRNLAIAGVATVVVAGLALSLAPGGFLSASTALAGSGHADQQTIVNDLQQALGTPGARPTPSGTPGGTATASGSPAASATPTPMPRTGSAPVPADLTPSLTQARADLPPIYDDGCHLRYDQITPGTCAFGDTSSSTTVVLYGDSHAAQWFPALELAAEEHHWRLVSLTKSACTPADIQVWDPSLNREYSECDAWRAVVLKRIASEHPALVVMVMSRGYSLALGGQSAPLAEHRSAFGQAIARTLTSLAAVSKQVALIEETPHSSFDPPVCLSAHLSDSLACTTPFAKAIDVPFRDLEIAAAAQAGVAIVDGTSWVCPSDPCPVVLGHVLVYRDSHHMTATFSAALADYLVAALPPVGP